MKYHIQIIRVRNDYWNTVVEASTDRLARQKALRKVKKSLYDGEEDFCDGDVAGYRTRILKSEQQKQKKGQ